MTRLLQVYLYFRFKVTARRLDGGAVHASRVARPPLQRARGRVVASLGMFGAFLSILITSVLRTMK